MKKKVLSLMMMMLAIFSAASFAQQAPQGTPLPLKEGLRTGVLPNGLTYYVLSNAEPKERANFYIAQKVGSTLETPEQLGLAHFLEHMAFNGTKTFPGKNLLNYLQSKGIRFGADINAYTGFDETVYNINNVPSKDVALMDSCLLALRDWSCNILLEESEIEAERGVIHEEWRTRNDAQTRMYTKILPDLYDEYQYEQMPIGSMDVVMNFKPEVLRAYYHKWYRPDQQGIVVVGDFDAAEMEQKVIKLFSEIPMPENAAERTYAKVSDNQEPIYTSFEDPELQAKQITVAFKYDKTPFEMRNTLEAYLNDNILEDVLATLINNRLQEYVQQNANCQYAYAGCRFGDFYVSKNKGAFYVMIIAKDDPQAALKDAMAVVTRACKTGFTNSELERVDSQMISNYEKLYNERDKTDSEALGREIISLFIENTPMPGIETEYQIVSQLLPTLPVEAVNGTAAALLTPQNQVIVVSQPKIDGQSAPDKATMVAALDEVLNAQYEAYVDEVITDPLIAKLRKPGKVKSQKENPAFGTTELTLSNGLKVVVKPTDYSADDVQMTLFREGGKRFYPESQAANVLLIEDALEVSNLGSFDQVKLSKYLAGKKVDLSMTVGLSTIAFDGHSTVKDLPTLMELVYATFTELNPNQEQYDLYMNRARPMIAAYENDPQVVFKKNVSKSIWGNNPLMEEAGLATIDAANYSEMLAMIKDITANAADYTMVLTGNVDLETLKPLLQTYIASLPSKGKKIALKPVNNIAIAQGEINNDVNLTTQTPMVVVYENHNGNNLDYTMQNDVLLDMFADILGNNYTTTLREEEGGTYGAGVYGQLLPASKQWMLVYTFQTGEEMAPKLIERANKEMLELFANGAEAGEFNKVKEATLAQLDIQMRNNRFWLNQLQSAERGYDLISGRRDFVQNLTLDDFNAAIAKFYDGKNRIQVILNGKAAK